MAGRRGSWRETFLALGEALIEVLRDELAVVGETLKRSGRALGIALLIAVLAGYLALVWLPALLIVAAVAGLVAQGVALWAAALWVGAIVTLLAAVLLLIVRHILKNRFENPAATLRRRLDDHVSWWNDRLLPDEPRLRAASRDSPSGGRRTDEESDADAGDPAAGDQPPTG